MCRPGSRPAARIAAAALALAVTGDGCQGSEPNRVPPEAASAAQPAGPVAITAIGRLEPKDGVRRVAGPSRPSVVIAKLLVEEGDHVTAGQAIAILDSLGEDQARIARAKAQGAHAPPDPDRTQPPT